MAIEKLLGLENTNGVKIFKSNQALLELQEEINNLYALKAEAYNKNAMFEFDVSSLVEAPQEIEEYLYDIKQLLDRLAGKTAEKDAQKVVQMIQKLCDAIMSVVKPFTDLGLPELPIIGSISQLLSKLQTLSKVYDSMDPEVKQQLEDEYEKKDKFGMKWTLPKNIKKYIADIKEDVEIIIRELPYIFYIFLFAIVMVIIDAITSIFKALGMGSFDVGKLIKGKGVSFSLDLDNFKPPEGILDAIPKAFPVCLTAMQQLPSLIESAITGIIKKIFAFRYLFKDHRVFPGEGMLSTIEKNIISCKFNLSAEQNYNDRIKNDIKVNLLKEELQDEKDKPKTSGNGDAAKAIQKRSEIIQARLEREITETEELLKTLKTQKEQIKKSTEDYIFVFKRGSKKDDDSISCKLDITLETTEDDG